MRRNRGRGWEDEGPTGIPPAHPKNVRMPMRSNGISQYSGARYLSADKEACHIDTKPSHLGTSPAEDKWDQSRHGGIHHIWQSQPDAFEVPYRSGRLPAMPGGSWVEDKREKSGLRRIDIEAVTHPHDCTNHLPE